MTALSVGVVQDQGDATNTKCMLRECKGDCTLADYYLNKLKATPSMLKYIVNGKLVLTSKDGGVHIRSSKYTAVFTGHDGCHRAQVVVCAGRGTVCQKPTLGIPVENPNHDASTVTKQATSHATAMEKRSADYALEIMKQGNAEGHK